MGASHCKGVNESREVYSKKRNLTFGEVNVEIPMASLYVAEACLTWALGTALNMGGLTFFHLINDLANTNLLI